VSQHRPVLVVGSVRPKVLFESLSKSRKQFGQDANQLHSIPEEHSLALVLDGEWNRRLHRRELDGGCLVRGGGFELGGVEDGRVYLGIANNRQQACVVPIQHGFEAGRPNERLVHNADHCAAVSAVKVEEPGDDVDCGPSINRTARKTSP